MRRLLMILGALSGLSLLAGCNPPADTPDLSAQKADAQKQPGANVPASNTGMSADQVKKAKSGD